MEKATTSITFGAFEKQELQVNSKADEEVISLPDKFQPFLEKHRQPIPKTTISYNNVVKKNLNSNTNNNANSNNNKNTNNTNGNESNTIFTDFDNMTLVTRVKSIEKKGLINEGNTCFLNSVFQSLISCPPFYNFLSSLQTKKISPILLCNFIKFFTQYTQRTSGQTISPLSFFGDSLIKFAPTLKFKRGGMNRRQEDAHEFLCWLLDAIHEELMQYKNITNNSTNTNTKNNINNNTKTNNNINNGNTNDFDDDNYNRKYGNVIFAKDEGWEEVGKNNKKSKITTTEFAESVVTKLFGSRLRSRFKARGQKESITYELFYCLPLDINSSQIQNVEDAINIFMSTSEISGQNKASKDYQFEKIPTVLVLQLKRFIYDGTRIFKIKRHIQFNDNLTLSDQYFSKGTKVTKGMRRYSLFAVVPHYGESVDSGHYISYVKHPTGEWVEYDDTEYRTVSQADVLRAQAYLLFYIQH